MEGKLRAAMERHWGYREFRPLQREAMMSLAGGRDGVVVLPTGGGKSLCFQTPAIVGGPAVVVSPLISLMQDQVAALDGCGVSAAFLNSSLSGAEANQVIARWRAGKLCLLYVAPERLVTSSFLALMRSVPPAFFAIDEAHCISHWGHDFRPEYRQLSMLRTAFPKLPIQACTATATARVRGDIAQQLNLREPGFFIGDFDRPNLHYRVQRRKSGNEQVAGILGAHKGESGIVYCITRNGVESMAQFLKGKGFRVAPYHAGLDPKTRRDAQRAFTNESIDAIVATVAFGMGIDRSNVRFVVHAGMPKSVEHYQQETGRAGRDGLPAECVLLYSAGDTIKWRGILNKSEDIRKDVLPIHLDKLKEMDDFASRSQCRHKFLTTYFGQEWTKDKCMNCDACLDQMPLHPDGTRTAQMILSCVMRLGESFGANYTAQVLRGETQKNVKLEHLNLSTFGLLKDEKLTVILDWIRECETQGLLRRDDGEYPVLHVTPEGWKVMRGVGTARLSQYEKPKVATERAREKYVKSKSKLAALDSDSQGLFEALRAMRMRIARTKNLPPYTVFHDSVLHALSVERPTTTEGLARIPGIGESKISQYGQELIRLIVGYAEEHDLRTDVVG